MRTKCVFGNTGKHSAHSNSTSKDLWKNLSLQKNQVSGFDFLFNIEAANHPTSDKWSPSRKIWAFAAKCQQHSDILEV